MRRARDEYAELVDCVVGWVEIAKVFEWGARGRGVCGWVRAKEEGGGDALIDGVFGNVDEEEGEHVREEKGLCSS